MLRATPSSAAGPDPGGSAGWSGWRAVVMLGLTSLAADLVYEGARSVYGPLLAALGAGAVVVGAVTGAGEAAALVLRLLFGPWTDRSGRYWAMTITGYALTVVSVPLLAVTPFLGGAGLAVGSALILLERTGKAVRSPAKTALLAQVAQQGSRGRGFGVHKALDQVGAFLGPLLVAAVVALTGTLWAGLAVLAVPGILAMAILLTTRAHVAEPVSAPRAGSTVPPDGPARSGWAARVVGAGLPAVFFRYAAAAGLTTGGLVTFGLIGYHLTVSGLTSPTLVPVVYACAMLAEAVAALVVGRLYDRTGPRVLMAVPVLVALVPGLALSGHLWPALVGVLLWGLAYGVQDSTVKALVADIVDAPRRATAYGVFAAVQGVAALAGGVLAGWLYERSLWSLVIVVASAQLVAMVLLARAFRLLPGSTGRAVGRAPVRGRRR